jgi:transcriptional regulator with XRE-family HTH domain
MPVEVSFKPRDSKRETASEVEALGVRLKSARVTAHLTLDHLAARSGVSRAMLSKVERGEKSPTLSIISRIARGLDLSLSALLGAEPDPAEIVVIPPSKRLVFKDPETGFERHLLSPTHIDNGVELLMHVIPPRSSSGDLPAYTTRTEKYVAVHEGALVLQVGEARYQLSAGDALYFEVRSSYRLLNEGTEPCVYYMVIVRQR